MLVFRQKPLRVEGERLRVVLGAEVDGAGQHIDHLPLKEGHRAQLVAVLAADAVHGADGRVLAQRLLDDRLEEHQPTAVHLLKVVLAVKLVGVAGAVQGVLQLGVQSLLDVGVAGQLKQQVGEGAAKKSKENI